MFQNIGEMMLLLYRTLQSLPLVFRQRFKVYDQLFEIGNASLLMACILSIFIGGVLTLQTGPYLAERGLASAIGGIVGYSLCRELAPVMMTNKGVITDHVLEGARDCVLVGEMLWMRATWRTAFLKLSSLRSSSGRCPATKGWSLSAVREALAVQSPRRWSTRS